MRAYSGLQTENEWLKTGLKAVFSFQTQCYPKQMQLTGVTIQL